MSNIALCGTFLFLFVVLDLELGEMRRNYSFH